MFVVGKTYKSQRADVPDLKVSQIIYCGNYRMINAKNLERPYVATIENGNEVIRSLFGILFDSDLDNDKNSWYTYPIIKQWEKDMEFLGYTNTRCGKIIIAKDGRKYLGYIVYNEKDKIEVINNPVKIRYFNSKFHYKWTYLGELLPLEKDVVMIDSAINPNTIIEMATLLSPRSLAI